MPTWKTIPGFEDYEASDDGHIRSKSRIRTNRHGINSWKRGKILAEMVQSGKGYKRVNVYAYGQMIQVGVHCLVAAAFIGPANGRHVNHIDFDVTNNRLTNLEYVTPAENIRHSMRHGRLVGMSGEDNPAAKLSRRDVLEIKSMIDGCIPDKKIARQFGICRGTVTAIRLGKIWGSLTGLYPGSHRYVRGKRYAESLMAAGSRLTYLGREESTGVHLYVHRYPYIA